MRQSRWAERITDKQLRTTRRVLDYCQFLFENGPTRTSYIHAYFNPAITKQNTTNRLKLMAAKPHKLVRKPGAQKTRYDANSSDLIYALDNAGLDLLLEHGRVTPQHIDWHKKLNGRGNPNFWHTMLGSDAMASIRLGLKQTKLRFVSVYEILEKAPKTTQEARNPLSIPVSDRILIPDGLFAFEDGDKWRYFLREDDMATEPVYRVSTSGTSYTEKMKRYQQAAQTSAIKQHLGCNNPFFLTITINSTHLNGVLRSARAFPAEWRERALFHAVPAFSPFEKHPVPSGFLFSKEWQRAGLPPVTIGG